MWLILKCSSSKERGTDKIQKDINKAFPSGYGKQG
jgi:hypothetical protein